MISFGMVNGLTMEHKKGGVNNSTHPALILDYCNIDY
jgi:hypothetical protein